MSRRQAMQRLAGLGTLGLTGVNCTIASNAVGSETIAAAQAFSSSFDNFKEQLGPTRVSFDRPLPTELTGTLYRNGPSLTRRGSVQHHHWFDGDGMVQSFHLQGQTLTHQGRVVQTDKYKAEQAAGKFLWSSFGTTVADAAVPQSADELNPANISVLPMGSEILALWEAGSAWRIDANTLATLGRKVFSPETDGMPFSAHPKTDVDGRIWNFGYFSGSNQLALYELEPSGTLKRVKLIESAKTDMVHDFAVTDKFLVFALMPITFTPPADPGFPSFLSMLSWDESSSVDILVIDKETLSVVNRYEMPPFFAFHFGNAWQDGSQLRIETARGSEFQAMMQQIEAATMGKAAGDYESFPAAIDIVVDLQAGRVSTEKLPFTGADFPVYDERFTGSKTDHLMMLERSDDMPDDVFGFNTIKMVNRHSSNARSWSYGPSVIAEEHVFVPARSAAEGRGWLLGTSYNWREQKTQLSVFATESLVDGPIATATLPYGLPIGLHGKYVASTP